MLRPIKPGIRTAHIGMPDGQFRYCFQHPASLYVNLLKPLVLLPREFDGDIAIYTRIYNVGMSETAYHNIDFSRES